jgi:hypothetical protein
MRVIGGTIMEEKDLYGPIKELLVEQGFSVKGEVNDIDIFAMRKDFSVAVELKTSITLKLIYQAIERQKIADSVFVGVPKEAIAAHRDSYKFFVTLLKRLEIGLIVVDQNLAKVAFESGFYDLSISKARNKSKKELLIKEFTTRKNEKNIGGSKGKTITAYKESVIKIAYQLSKLRVANAKELQDATQIDNVSSILQKNYDGWFNRVNRGNYELTDLALSELPQYRDIYDPEFEDEIEPF